ncbi:MAG TPA: sensor domain-containing diguanylate cyclase [Xanthobacteraceae bacterium]|nr:sensor domain-containing diguanylate cyclase [Xanthobacteraceae bacterium]
MADDCGKSRVMARRKTPILSIRARLIVMALFAIVPLIIERVHGLENARAARTERANAEVVELARHGVESQQQIIYSVRALLQIVSRVYAREAIEPPNCNEYLADLTTNIPWIRDLSVATPDGRIKCSTNPLAVGLNVGERAHFQNALNAREFALSDYLINRLNQVPSLVATFPVIAGDGSVKGVVLAVINLQWIGDLAASAAQRSGASVMLLDGNGTLVAGSADQQAYIGKQFASHALAQEMLASDDGTAMARGFDGVRRIFAYVRVPWTHARLAVGLDERAVHSGIDNEIDIAYVQLGLFGVFVLLLAWFAGEQLVVRPIRALVRTAARFGRGDLRVRASQEPWVAEFAPLAAALDDMAAKLAEREDELQTANQHLDELASLDGLTGLANRRGFDRQLEREWQRAGETRQAIALMMVDIDHFKLFNDRYGHVAGDTCLRAVGETLSLVSLEHAVLVARYGGEEFALLLPGLDIERGAALADEARRTVEDLMINHSESPCGHVTVSIGVQSMVPEKFQTPAELIEAADAALYEAKRRGRNKVVVHRPALLRMAS